MDINEKISKVTADRQKKSEHHEKISKIIDNTTLSEQQRYGINFNPASNFVVVTYWWGRGNLNRNMARPCTNFYEDYLKQVNKHMMTLIQKTQSKESGYYT